MTDVPRYVRLSPPLPCAASELGLAAQAGAHIGFVLALAPDRLLVRFAESQVRAAVAACGDDQVGPRGGLAVSLSDSRAYSFHFELALPQAVAGLLPDDEALEARINDPISLARLADLLTLVRKGQHIAICETMDVEASDRYTGFSD